MNGTLYNPAVEQTIRVWDCNHDSTDEINHLLHEGWQVVSVTGAGAGAGAAAQDNRYGTPEFAMHTAVYFFVVLERRRS